jgi:hypothetical protein
VGHNFEILERHSVCYCWLSNKIAHKSCVFIISLYTKRRLPGFSASRVIAIRPEGKENIYTVTLFLFYILQFKYSKKFHIFCGSIFISGPLK